MFPQSLGSTPPSQGINPRYSNVLLAKTHSRNTKGVEYQTNSFIPNHWEGHPIARQRSTLSQCAACKNALQKLKGCGAFNHKIYSQSLGSTLHHEASIHTIPMCSLQNHIAEAHRVREIYSQDVFPITGEHAPSQGINPYYP